MSKPTLFFSHSSKDKEMVLTIKNMLAQYTSGTIDIFQSSDGESIPFGTNWIHKVEEGLKEAKVMFVFVTEKSISSGWIFFEAGYAYSKGIHVIPVGVGVSVGELKAPLNLLQGFNITSADSLNNFLTIINREFNYNFSPQFTDKDYEEIMALLSPDDKRSTKFDEIIQTVNYELDGEYRSSSGYKECRNTRDIFNRIVKYLEDHKLQYSLSNPDENRHDWSIKLSVSGIKFIYSSRSKDDYCGTIYVKISPYNFEKSFELYLELQRSCFADFSAFIQLRLNSNFKCVIADQDCAALLLQEPSLFSLSKSNVSIFESEKLGLYFRIYNASTMQSVDYILGITYDPFKVKTSSIIELVDKLYELSIINIRN